MDKSCTGKPRIRSPFQVTISLLSITPSTNTKVNTEAEGAAAGQKFLISFIVNDERRRNKMDLKKRKLTLHH